MSKRMLKAKTAQQALIDYRNASILVTFVNNTGYNVTVQINEEQGTVLVRIDEDGNEVRFQAHNYHR